MGLKRRKQVGTIAILIDVGSAIAQYLCRQNASQAAAKIAPPDGAITLAMASTATGLSNYSAKADPFEGRSASPINDIASLTSSIINRTAQVFLMISIC